VLPPIEVILGINDFKPEPVSPSYTLEQKYQLFLKLRDLLLVDIKYNSYCTNFQGYSSWERSFKKESMETNVAPTPIIEYAKKPYIKTNDGGIAMVRPDFATFCDLLDQGRL